VADDVPAAHPRDDSLADGAAGGAVHAPRPVVLASASPRRRELLDRLGVAYVVRPPDVDEAPLPGEGAVAYVRRLAVEKASAVAGPGELVIGADTTIEIDGDILTKAADEDEARTMLRRLSGRTHHVHTGIAVVVDARRAVHVETTAVEFAALDPITLRWYLDSGEWRDRAGAYAIQGAGDLLVSSVRGSVTNVIGLPLRALDALVRSVTGAGLAAVGAGPGDAFTRAQP
jgi:septum formation protein